MKNALILAVTLLLSQVFGVAMAQTEKYAKPWTDAEYDAASRKFLEGLPSPPPKPALGPIDKWRYESCQQDAATAPTQSGVNIKMRVCRQKFDQ